MTVTTDEPVRSALADLRDVPLAGLAGLAGADLDAALARVLPDVPAPVPVAAFSSSI